MQHTATNARYERVGSVNNESGGLERGGIADAVNARRERPEEDSSFQSRAQRVVSARSAKWLDVVSASAMGVGYCEEDN